MADHSVVVNKSEPMKAGNSLEDKAQMSMRGVFFFGAVQGRGKKIKSHNLLPLQKREDRGKGNVLRQRL
ncbi:hypothetical protein ASG89_21750 [Paenibacillus sp. Soil766]|uniref:hypothetical protein n=1 Tax=Paenibacillus sp. Soil766 TaxID=1736404 RepID=UPI00070E97C1|nr:hypothetical protein [Paenibacillus sp. Soil766]KRF04473.1 hypothetical protein ASG89_21750 [Paenibacillus sp. Soil766]